MIKYIDLFAGMGGTRIGFEQACEQLGLKAKCVFTSEIKSYAVELYKHNFPNEQVFGDITEINENDLPDFEFLLGGFPCQAFSSAGKRHGFNDTRGTLFFDIARILKHKKPKGFLLENVEGLVTHDRKNTKDKTGNTLDTIIDVLNEIGYKVSWKVLNSSDFGIPQKRKRIYITGTLIDQPDLNDFLPIKSKLYSVLEQGIECNNTDFTNKLLELYTPEFLAGKAIKDKRGGINNIHSWDLELKGPLNKLQKKLMSQLLKERRRKVWAEEIGIEWMDGMPLTLEQISTFFNIIDLNELQNLLTDLTEKNYIKFEHPKALVTNEQGIKVRVSDVNKPKGYNIVTGKLSFEFNKILDPNDEVNTIVATETSKLGVLDQGGIRTLTDRECLRLFGFPEWYKVNISQKDLYDLIGNTVVVPVIRSVAYRTLKAANYQVSPNSAA
ncbi:DNA (cytosine-5-)-methyltransferase [Rheinheimera sp. D18]|uniref:DNA (cytosine-5-)-methyltransferase n=1 Tax=Rheinheimera sp. D18 TaxID=2545632 RepID=UPI001047FC6F|nr:DNA (cytosine-5-)-methyltransferase [Rheinheimera sp. D18]QBL10452.1 DNA (cytosine-5-)-methyltransferase [Rheinheimera sp. D18]